MIDSSVYDPLLGLALCCDSAVVYSDRNRNAWDETMTEATAKQHAAPSSTPADRKLAKAVERANQAFTEKNLRFTKLRQDVFEEIAATYTPRSVPTTCSPAGREGNAPRADLRLPRHRRAARGWRHPSPRKQECLLRLPSPGPPHRPPADLPRLREVQRRAGGRLGRHLRHDRPPVARGILPAAGEVRGSLRAVPQLRQQGLRRANAAERWSAAPTCGHSRAAPCPIMPARTSTGTRPS